MQCEKSGLRCLTRVGVGDGAGMGMDTQSSNMAPKSRGTLVGSSRTRRIWVGKRGFGRGNYLYKAQHNVFRAMQLISCGTGPEFQVVSKLR